MSQTTIALFCSLKGSRSSSCSSCYAAQSSQLKSYACKSGWKYASPSSPYFGCSSGWSPGSCRTHKRKSCSATEQTRWVVNLGSSSACPSSLSLALWNPGCIWADPLVFIWATLSYFWPSLASLRSWKTCTWMIYKCGKTLYLTPVMNLFGDHFSSSRLFMKEKLRLFGFYSSTSKSKSSLSEWLWPCSHFLETLNRF